MFKIFLIVLGSIAGIWIGSWIVRLVYRFVKEKVSGLKKTVKEKMRKPTPEELERQKEKDFSDRLVQQYKDTCFKLMKKEAIAAKLKKELASSIEENVKNAKNCKELFQKTSDEQYKKKAYIFLQEAENSRKLLALANETIEMCSNRINSAEVEFYAVVNKLKNQRIEYVLLDSKMEDGYSTSIAVDFEGILKEYSDKLDLKRIDAQVEKSMSEQKALEAAKRQENTFDLSILNKELEVEFEKL